MTRYYMLVTNDVYELPLSAPMSANAMAKRTGMRPDSVRWCGSPANIRRMEKRGIRKNKPYKVVAVDLDDEVQNE